MAHGFIYPITNWLIQKVLIISLVEVFKTIATVIVADDNESKRRAAVMAIDIHHVFKFVFLALLIVPPVTTNMLATWFVAYMLASNLFSYFYYHVWGSNFTQSGDRDSVRRRFLNLMLAVAFFLLGFTYLYLGPFAAEFEWPEGQANFVNALYMSIANAFTLTYGDFEPLTQTARVLFMIELLNTFVFIAIIVAISIPKPIDEKRD